MSFLGDLAFLDGLRIDHVFEATDADSLGVDAVCASASDGTDDVILVSFGVLFGGEAGVEFLVGVFVKTGDEVDLRPAVEADLARTMAEMVASTGSSSGFG